MIIYSDIVQLLEEKVDLEAALSACEQASRGWFEEQEDFTAMAALDLKEAKVRYNNRVKKGGSSGSSGGKTGTNKITGSLAGRGGGPSSGGYSTGGWSSVKKPSGTTNSVNKKAPGSSSGFAAAFAGSDSDD